MNDTIKMFIAGEEVVSNSDFTINEEMLSASSTILNNCYPKSWEIDKDYVSNFYFPKDYSKFILANGEYLHGNSEYAILTESGSNPFYTTNVEKEWNSLNVYGNTYQATRSGKNLFDKSKVLLDKALNRNNNNLIDLAGYSTSDYCNVLPNTQYYLGIAYSSSNYGIVFYNSNKEYISGQQAQRTFTTPANTYYIRFTWKTADYDINTLQLEQGSTPSSYQPYGVMPSPDYPSELVSVGYENLFDYTTSAFSVPNNVEVIAENNTLTMTTKVTTASTNLFFLTKIPDELLKNGETYTISSENVSGVAQPLLLQLRNKDGSNANKSRASSVVYDDNYSLYVDGNIYATTGSTSIPSGTVAIIKNIQVVKDTQAHNYIPYGKYGIEIKNIGKNLFQGGNTTTSNGITFTKNNDGSYNIVGTSTAAAVCDNYVNVKSTGIVNGETYTISANQQLPSGVYIQIETYNGTTYIKKVLGSDTVPNTATADITGATRIRFRLRVNNGITLNISNLKIQLERGSQATNYEAYRSNSQSYILDAPLRAIGNYKDRLFIQDGVLYVERNIKSIIFDGSADENWGINSSGTINYSYRLTMVGVNAIEKIALSNYFIRANITNSNTNEGIDIWNVASGSQVRIRFGVEMTLANFKNWLSTHNTELIYVLEEPTTTPIGYVNIPNAYEGQNTTYLYTGLETTMDVLYYWKNFNVLFAGVVKNTGDISLNPRYPHYCSLQILDYKTFLSESNTLDFVIANKTIREAITMVVNAVSNYGFEVGTINIAGANDIIGAYSTLNKSAYDVLQYLAEISGSRWRTRYIDSSSMAIDFYDPATLPQGTNIDYTSQYWEDNNIIDLTFNYSTRDYRNKQILLSDEVYANIDYNETLISNGYSNTFTLQNNVGNIISIIVNNQEKTFVTTNDKQMGIDADFYYALGKNTLESNVIYPAGTMIYLTYQPLVKGRQIVYNSSEVERISQQTDTEGVIARYESRNDILSSDELEKIAQTYIEYKGKAEVILTLKTQNKDLYNVGEVVYFDAPIDDLKQNYMVKAKRINYIVINSILSLFYEYELTSSFNSEKAINYFDNQRNKASGNISSGDSITRNIDIETDVNIIWNNGTISSASITIVGDNELNSTLNSPFVD